MYLAVNSIGIIRIDIPHDDLIRYFVARVEMDAPLMRMGEAFDVAKGVVFLASSDANFITGTNLKVDGGYVFHFV